MNNENKIKDQIEKILSKIEITEDEYFKTYKKIIKTGKIIENSLSILNFLSVFVKTFSVIFITLPKFEKHK